MLLYVHFPFCRSKCTYCAFHSRVFEAGEAAQYLRTLLQEIDSWSRSLDRPVLDSVYFGGGTPSLLPAEILETVVQRLRQGFVWPETLEFTLEANPESARRPGFLRHIRRLGVNRLSLGIQSLDNDVLALLGRPHTAKQAIQAVETARKTGFTNLSLDMLWGLPGQKSAAWLRDLQVISGLGPEHLSCYGLTLEPGTPLEEMVRLGRLALPDEGEQARMFKLGAELLDDKGYLQYEISNFARMGFTCRHNLGYWEGVDYLGLGPSAVSTLQDRRWENPRDLAAYGRAVAEGTLDRDAEILTPAVRARELVMLGLRTSRGLRLKQYTALTGRNFLEEHARLIPLLHKRRLIRIRDGFFRLTRAGFLVSNSILTSLFADDEPS